MRKIRRQGQLNKRNQKTSDAGFSLVELLIAVTILAIIVIPLLHLFVTSTRINVKSRQTLRATTVAQDIMEGLKAYTLEEVSAQFEPPEGVSGSGYHYPSDGFYILNSSLIQGGVRDLTEDMAEYDGVYYFGIENLKMQGGEYDALIRLDASTYGTNSKRLENGTYKNPTGVHDNQFNGRFYAEVGSVAEVSGSSDETTKTTDSSYHENKELAAAIKKDAKKYFEEQITGAGDALPDDWEDEWEDYKIEDIVDKRTINVVIDYAGNEQCQATINFKYECSCPYSGYSYIYINNEDAGTTAVLVENITRTFSSGNFYLFYYPIYKSGKLIDNINFRIEDTAKLCDEDEPLLKSITLAKQIRSDIVADGSYIVSDLTEAELRAKESAYLAKVEISADSALGSKLTFRRNVDTNMVKKINPITGKAEWDQIIGITSVYDTNISAKIDECDFTGEKASEKVTNIIYDIEITVYQTGAAQHFTEAHFEDNDDVHKLATITNMN